MKITWKTFLAVSAYWAGVFGWFYIGVWQVLKKPVHSVILAQIAGHLSIGLLIGAEGSFPVRSRISSGIQDLCSRYT